MLLRAHADTSLALCRIDSDTRVPRDCLLDAACEMQASPEVAVLQHCSGTFLAGAGYFEN